MLARDGVEVPIDGPWGLWLALGTVVVGAVESGRRFFLHQIKKRAENRRKDRIFNFQHTLFIMEWCKAHGIEYREDILEIDNLTDFYALMKKIESEQAPE
ncbi:hypothetical protein KGP36_06080 [Patescibacteria group bacterium]|nr:hypothetical protein [Patescibacteria group bacterium]